MGYNKCSRCGKLFRGRPLCPNCDTDKIRAEKREAAIECIKMGEGGDHEREDFPRDRKDKRRNCAICGENIPPLTVFYKSFEYPYEPEQIRWYACQKCFDKHYPKTEKKETVK